MIPFCSQVFLLFLVRFIIFMYLFRRETNKYHTTMNAVQKKMPESDFLALTELICSEKVTFLASSKIKTHH